MKFILEIDLDKEMGDEKERAFASWIVALRDSATVFGAPSMRFNATVQVEKLEDVKRAFGGELPTTDAEEER